MASPNTRVATADFEAAEWHKRLGVRSVSTKTLEEFFAWKADPKNDDAYRRVERVWSASGRLSGDPQIHDAVAEAMSRGLGRRGKQPIRGRLFAAAGVVAVIALTLGAWSWMESRSVHATSVGEQQVLQLADGSTVRLDTHSRIRVRFAGGERRVLLEEGQALFEVAHDADRPFVVEAAGTEVTAVGTVFDVRRSGPEVRVTLVSGVVDVVAAEGVSPSRMAAGQQARISAERVSTRAVDTATATSWTSGRLVFEDTPLSVAVAEVNRYLTSPIVLEGEGIGEVPVSGVFRAGDRDAFSSAAAEGLDLSARNRADGAVILSGRKK